MKDTRPSLEPSLILFDAEKPPIIVFEKFSGITIKLFCLIAQVDWPINQEVGVAPVYRQKICTTLKPFAALAFIPELVFKVGTTASCRKVWPGRQIQPLRTI